MRALHFALFFALDRALAVLLLKLDARYLQSQPVRDRGWTYSTFGAIMYQLGSLGVLGWFFVTRFRFTRLVLPRRGAFARRLRMRAARVVLGLASGVAALLAVAVARTLVDELVFGGLLGLPPFMR